MTILEQFKGHEQEDLRVKYPERLNDDSRHTANGLDENARGLDRKVEVEAIVLGAGQSGICTASYLQAIGISYLALERNPNVGDNWVFRYDHLKVRNVWYAFAQG